MVDFQKFISGKDQRSESGLELDGVFYSDLEIIIALGKALIKKGVLTKAEIKSEL